MADNFAARKCDKYKVVSMLPDVCMTPTKNGAPTPYPITIKLKGSASVSKNVNFNSNGAFLHKKSDTVKVKGDKPGQGKGIKSGTVGKKAESITSSPSVRINGKQLVRENDLFYMNNKNTIGKLTTTESGSASHITDDGKVAGKTIPDDTNEKSLWEKIKTGVANKWEDVKYNASHFNDPKTGFNAFYQDKLGKGVASWTTDSVGAVGQALEDGYKAVASGDIKGAGMAALTGVKKGHPLISKANKVYEKIDGAVDKVDQVKGLANGELPAGSGKKKKSSKKKKDNKDGGKSKAKEKEDLKCGEGGKYAKLKKKNAMSVGMERDHVPSGGALKKRALELNRGKELTGTQIRKIENIGHTLAIPKEIHASHSLTFKGRNTPAQIAKDANNLQKAAIRDLRAVKKGLPAECRKLYEKYAKKIRKISNDDYDEKLLEVLQ